MLHTPTALNKDLLSFVQPMVKNSRKQSEILTTFMPLVKKKSIKNYAQLRDEVKETLLLGQQRIEETKVQTYFKTVKLIDEHILKNSSRQGSYGKEVIERLSADLEISSSVLCRCLQFARSFKKILARGRESLPKSLAWSHYRKLITVDDEDTRLSFMQRAEKGGWSAEELGGKIHLEIASHSKDKAKSSVQNAKKDLRPYPKLIPKKGKLYTYRLIAPDSVHDGDDRLWVDLGFQVHRKVPVGVKGFKEGGIAESYVSGTGEYSIVSSQRSKDDLFTYKAFVERVVDADTLIVKIDLGFENRIRQYLRLRGINAPELSKVPYVILTSSRSDKYDRYLADVYYGEGEQEKYLNQVLLDEGLAERMN